MTLPSGLPRVRRRYRQKMVLIVSLVGMAVAAGLLAGVVRFASQRPDRVNLGEKVLRLDAERLADQIAEQGAPLLLKDPLSSQAGREVYVQHLGADDRQGWLIIEAYAPNAARRIDCILRWDRATKSFVDPCAGGTFPADGTGLRTWPAEVDKDGKVIIDLRTAAAP